MACLFCLQTRRILARSVVAFLVEGGCAAIFARYGWRNCPAESIRCEDDACAPPLRADSLARAGVDGCGKHCETVAADFRVSRAAGRQSVDVQR